MDLDSVDIDEQLAILEEIEGNFPVLVLIFLAEQSASKMSRIMGESDEVHSIVARRHFVDLDSFNEELSISHPPKRRKTLLPQLTPPTRLECYLHNRIPSSGDYIPVTFADGRRRYLCVESDTTTSNLPSILKQHKRLLPEDLCKLIYEAEQLVG